MRRLAASATLGDATAVERLATSATQAHLGLHGLLGGLTAQFGIS